MSRLLFQIVFERKNRNAIKNWIKENVTSANQRVCTVEYVEIKTTRVTTYGLNDYIEIDIMHHYDFNDQYSLFNFCIISETGSAFFNDDVYPPHKDSFLAMLQSLDRKRKINLL
jgi:hypothetical protein